MAETGAVFGGEHSAHYYFRDNCRADSGLIAALVVLEQLSAAGQSAVRAAQAVRALRRVGRDQHEGGRPARRDRAGRRRLRGRRPGPPRRPHRRPRRLVVQPPPVQHRAAAAPQPRGRRPPRAVRRTTSPRCAARIDGAQSDDLWHSIRQLLEILACPEDKGPLLYFADEDVALQPAAEAALRDPRRHPHHADRRGRDRRRRRGRAAARQGRGRGHQADVRRRA